MPRISENELILPSLFLMSLRSDGCITTTELIKELTALLKPTGEDAQILAGRNDTKFSQKVRNLKSHGTLENLGFAVYSPPSETGTRSGKWCITLQGRNFVQNNIEIVKYLLDSPFSYDDIKSSFNKIVNEEITNPQHKIIPLDENIVINEGSEKFIRQKTYERSKKLRDIAITHYMKDGKILCDICCFDFGAFYGELGQGYIEIHHIKPIFMFDDEDSEKTIEEALQNVIPVCSNCHRIIHRNRISPVSIEEMKRHVNKKLYFCA